MMIKTGFYESPLNSIGYFSNVHQQSQSLLRLLYHVNNCGRCSSFVFLQKAQIICLQSVHQLKFNSNKKKLG